MAFKFRLQTLLEHKQRQEEEVQIELAILRENHRLECLALEALEGDEANQRRLLREQQGAGSLDLPAIRITLDYIDAVRAKELAQRDVIDGLAAKIEDARLRLLTVMRERKTLEKLKERQHEQYLREEKRLEGRTVDEISMVQHVRRRR